MSIDQIRTKQLKESVRFELATQIRALLDDAKKKYGADDWENDDMDNLISDLVFEEV